MFITIVRKFIFVFATLLLNRLMPRNMSKSVRIALCIVSSLTYSLTALIPERNWRSIISLSIVTFWLTFFALLNRKHRIQHLCIAISALSVSLIIQCLSLFIAFIILRPFTIDHDLIEAATIPFFLLLVVYIHKRGLFDPLMLSIDHSLVVSIFACEAAVAFIAYSILIEPYKGVYRKYYLLAFLMLLIIEASIYLVLKLLSKIHRIPQQIIHDDHARKNEFASIERRLSELERRSLLISRSYMTESSGEIAVMQEELAAIEHRENSRARSHFLAATVLPKTGLSVLDSQLSLFCDRCIASDVELNVHVQSDLHTFSKQHHVSPEVLRRVVCILADNALEAFGGSKTTADSINLLLGYVNGVYRIEVMDNAPPFPPAILQQLGKENNTTNGTGIGLPDLLDAIEPYHASFIIEELSEDRALLTKSVIILFDGASRRIVLTRRAPLLRMQHNIYGFLYVSPEQMN